MRVDPDNLVCHVSGSYVFSFMVCLFIFKVDVSVGSRIFWARLLAPQRSFYVRIIP